MRNNQNAPCFREKNTELVSGNRETNISLEVKVGKNEYTPNSTGNRENGLITLDTLPKADFSEIKGPLSHNNQNPDVQVVTHIVNNRALIQCLPVPEKLFDQNDAVSLFHELLHWFHFLVDPIRHSAESDSSLKNSDLGKIIIVDEKTTVVKSGKTTTIGKDFTVVVGHYYYGVLLNSHNNDMDLNGDTIKNRAAVSAIAWYGNNKYVGHEVDYEEMRNILGGPSRLFYTMIVHNNPNINSEESSAYLEGDDLSENLFRLSLIINMHLILNMNSRFNMRFGHNSFTFFEDAFVVWWTLGAIYCTAQFYFDTIRLFPLLLMADDKWNECSSKAIPRTGLGQCALFE
jgi:hypothetical protein